MGGHSRGGDRHSVISVPTNNHIPNLLSQFSIATSPPEMNRNWREYWSRVASTGAPPAGTTGREHNDRLLVQQLDLYSDLCDGAVYEESRAPRFHTYGLRKNTNILPNGRKVEVRGHRWEYWRQSEPRAQMLHLADSERARMGVAVNKFFIFQFKGKSTKEKK